jgi:hypothetical protein
MATKKKADGKTKAKRKFLSANIRTNSSKIRKTRHLKWTKGHCRTVGGSLPHDAAKTIFASLRNARRKILRRRQSVPQRQTSFSIAVATSSVTASLRVGGVT